LSVVSTLGDAASLKAPAPSSPRVQYDPEKMMANLREAIEHLNKQMSNSGRTLGFTMDEVLRTPIVTVKDTRSGEVIRQIPSETVVRVAHTLEDLKGLLYDQSS
jgi:flagellar protein FlaG